MLGMGQVTPENHPLIPVRGFFYRLVRLSNTPQYWKERSQIDILTYHHDSHHMKYGRIAGNSHINALIYRCFEKICEKDQRAFLKKFRDQPQH
jgi:hypothetical protein